MAPPSPTPNLDPAVADAVRPEPNGPEGTPPAAEAPPEADLFPIGIERLRQLREAIRSGTYPTERDVVEGLARMFGGRG
jgi:hypothetical protein